MIQESNYTLDTINVGLTIILILLNGFFVAAEFAIVKLTTSKVKTMIREKRLFSNMAMWLFQRQNMALSACQLGITMASLALGWIGEPAIAHLISPLISKLGFTSVNLVHGIAFAIAFTIITSLHIVVGEQVPKIYAIRKPDTTILGTSLLLKGFYILLFPFMYVLNNITNRLLKLLGITESDGHDTPLTEEEIRSSLSLSYGIGELTTTEHKLLNAVFKFDDEEARRIMIPRSDVEIINTENSYSENLDFIRNSNHSRFPLCKGSLDKVVGVVHIKDIVKQKDFSSIDFEKLARPPILIPENILLSKLLHEFRTQKQHFAFVQDEYGTNLGIITLEDVLEELVGNLADEFSIDQGENISRIDEITYLVEGDTLIDDVNEKLNTNLGSEDADTISGLIVEKIGHNLKIGAVITLSEGVKAELVKVDGIRVLKIKLILDNQKSLKDG